MVLGLHDKVKFSYCKIACDACIRGKQACKSFPNLNSQAYGKLDVIHSDVRGSSELCSKGGSNYFITFVDGFSRKNWVFFLINKYDVYSSFGVL